MTRAEPEFNTQVPCSPNCWDMRKLLSLAAVNKRLYNAVAVLCMGQKCHVEFSFANVELSPWKIMDATKMMKKIILVFLFGIISLVIIAPSGYELTITGPVVLYETNANVPFNMMPVSAHLQAGDLLSLVGCIDDGNDFYFYVKTSSGDFGYLYDFKYTVAKRFVYSKERLDYFFSHPRTSIDCHSMAPGFSDR